LNELLKTVILGLIQGITEWLPISSTGHLKIAEHFLNLEVPILFDVTLHMGTLIVILVFFRKDVEQVISAFSHLDFETEYGRLIPLIIVGTLPTVLIGFVFGGLIEETFKSLSSIALAFILCGVILYAAKKSKEKTDNITYLQAFLIGTAQGIAIIPGISRSGTTISIALLFGIKRKKGFRFSFLLSIPAIVGALGLTLYTQFEELTAGLGWAEIFAGTIAAVFVGYFALKLLWKTLVKKKFHLFAFYCWFVGILLLLASSAGS
jgi:undecaprenyl-diphosphatase